MVSSSFSVMFVIETELMVEHRWLALSKFHHCCFLPLDETGDDQREAPRERPRLQLQPRSKPLESLQPLSASSSSVNNVAANVTDSSISNADETGSLGNTSTGQLQDLSHEHRDDTQHESNDDASRANPSEESAASKAARGVGASIFGGAKPVDTAAREAEIERKLKQMQMASNEGSRDEAEEKSAPPRYREH